MQRVEPARWRAAIVDAIAGGHDCFVTLMGLDDGGVQVWLRLRRGSDEALRAAAGDDVVFTVDARDGVDTIIDLLPEAAWCEREAAEMFGITFHGHETAPLLLPAGTPPPMRVDAWLEARQTPWPGAHDPGAMTTRRRQLPPGVRP